MFARILSILIYITMSIPLTLIGILFVISVIVLPSKMNTFGRLTSICVLKCLFVKLRINGNIPTIVL